MGMEKLMKIKRLILAQSQEEHDKQIVEDACYRMAKSVESLINNIKYQQIVSEELAGKFHTYMGFSLRDVVDTQQVVDFYLANARTPDAASRTSKALEGYVWKNINRYGNQLKQDAISE
jgi:predicted component of viral defense system (DUF524 family)